jgi:hypothetical protein
MQALLTLLLSALLAARATAGTTTIDLTQVARVAEGQLVVELTVGNSGDEAALSVTPILRFGEQEVRGQGAPRLDPDASFEETLSLPVGTLADGRWPYLIAVDYTDGNQYPFQALQARALVVGSPPPAKVVVPAIEGGDLAGTGTLRVTVKSLTPEPRTARVRVLVPDGIEATDVSREVSLDGWQDATLEVPLTNRTALVGSVYPVFVTAEYEDGPVHQAVVAQGQLAIVGVGSFIDRYGRWLSIAGAALVALWLVSLGASRLLRRPATPGS